MTSWKKDGMEQMENEMIDDFLGYSKQKSSSQVNTASPYKKKRKEYTSEYSSSRSYNTQRAYPKYDRTGNLENADELSWQAYLDDQEDY